MPSQIEQLLGEYVAMLKELYGEHLKHVLLYGSYARGDYHEDSDIDIMILVDMDEDAIRATRRVLSDKTYDINYDHNVMIMPIIQNLSFFHKWVRSYPFYNSVNNEGVELYAAA